MPPLINVLENLDKILISYIRSQYTERDTWLYLLPLSFSLFYTIDGKKTYRGEKRAHVRYVKNLTRLRGIGDKIAHF